MHILYWMLTVLGWGGEGRRQTNIYLLTYPCLFIYLFNDPRAYPIVLLGFCWGGSGGGLAHPTSALGQAPPDTMSLTHLSRSPDRAPDRSGGVPSLRPAFRVASTSSWSPCLQGLDRFSPSVFKKLEITAQSGPVILIILCRSHCPPKGGSMVLIRTSINDQTRQRGHTLST